MASRPNRINIDLGPYKTPWLAYCRANGVTSNQAFRQIVAKLTADAGQAAPAPVSESGDKTRKEIRLTTRECRYVAASAERQGVSQTRWIVALIRARMTQAPQLGQSELEMLGQSNLILLGIARQLRRIVGAGSTIPMASGELPAVVRSLQDQMSRHVGLVAEVLASNLARWGTA